ncbi:imm11 family protein [Thalassolituus sp.]|uniref:imm11 family protein n=3 Tax=Thalassolituus sp. TaxID=2030822 RepID=UPI003519161C
MVHSDVIYSLEVEYDTCKTFVPKDGKTIRCKGMPLELQQPLVVEPDEEDTGLPLCDVSLVNVGSFVVSNDLYEYLKPLAGDTAQFIELQWHNVQMWLCNVVNVVDCLDQQKSEMNPFGGVAKAVFDISKIPEQGFFKIKEDNFTGIYLSPAIYEALIAYQPSGVEFEGAVLT